MFDPRDLEALIAVADHGGIAAAARALNSSQPAVTRRLQRLERQVGQSLVRRGPHGSVLLRDGQALVARARQVVRLLVDLQRPASESGPVLGVLASVEGWLVPRLLDRMPAELSQAFRPRTLEACRELQVVADGQAEAAVITEWRPDDRPDGLAVLDLLLEPYVVLLPSRHRLLTGHALELEALRGEDVVSPPHPDCGGRFAESGGSQRMAASLVHAEGLVARGDGVAVWPSCTSTSLRLPARAVGDHRAARRLSVAVRAESLRSPAMRRLLDVLASACKARPGRRGRFLWPGIPGPLAR
ncbi:LysR family transcriptional regulator [Solirubrobacter sp. CPCC 204708]|uniref:LysR family transcriptional regulator n=1 Tax=Solirubrobacter deserti TaxID=2282478 RepID=A0ABT4RPD1_9ACTN|nr:LysR family transcriptional regulator [Solirubrobacter deserti]MBE2315738.1 LysR family transcriptional regulator [Solirubrobacter deserti]MDA0140372.1 LysR family transcriptional regulator [Solirubrobacter deserti]